MQRQTALREAQPALREVRNDAPSPLSAAGRAPHDDAATELFKRWLDLSELERRAFAALTQELAAASEQVEASTLDLSERFQALAVIARTQKQQVDAIVTMAQSIQVDGEAVPLQVATASVEQVLRRVIETILSVSKHAMRMVYALDDVVEDVKGAEQCVIQIKAINTQTRYLALNTAIEANRLGEAGALFRVIATEIKDLAHSTEQTSQDVQQRIAAITRGVRSSHEVLQEIATLDLSEHIMAKEQLDKLVEGIIAQNHSFTEVLATTVTTSAEMAKTIGQLVTGMQFQDRTKQHVEHVIAVLGVLGEATRSVREATMAAHPGRFEAGVVDQDWLSRIVDGQTLGAVKQRLLARLLTDGDAGDPPGGPDHQPDDDSAGDVELF